MNKINIIQIAIISRKEANVFYKKFIIFTIINININA